MKKISIIVPVYNTEKYLEQSINSILNQTYENLEIIIVDDGSTDSSGLICEKYFKIDSRVKVIHKKNGGQSSARNLGLDLASGDYIGFVDSDDWISANMYEKLIIKAIQNNSDIVASNIWYMKKNKKIKKYSKTNSDLDFNRLTAMEEIFTNENLTFSPCNKLYKKKLFDFLRFDEKIILEDMDISYQLIDKSEIISYLSEPLYYYRYNPSSTLRGKFNLRRLDEHLVKKRMYDYYLYKYPSLSAKVYINFFEVGLILYSTLKAEKKFDIENYTFLIDFDKQTLLKILEESDLNFKIKLKIYLFLKSPNLLILILENKYKLRNRIY